METKSDYLLHRDIEDLTLSEIVSHDYKAAGVFEKYNLDFCCGGSKPLSTACEEKGLDAVAVIKEILSTGMNSVNSDKYNDWNLEFLIEYIINNHHTYVTRMIPIIAAHTRKIADVHGNNHPEVIEVAKIFERLYKDLKQHMLKEEQILFPFVKKLVEAKNNESVSEAPYFGTVKNPIRIMEAEHQAAGDELHEIRHLTGDYYVPDDVCATYKATMQELKEFEEDLHKHVYLENYILFPKSIDLEQELLKDN